MDTRTWKDHFSVIAESVWRAYKRLAHEARGRAPFWEHHLTEHLALSEQLEAVLSHQQYSGEYDAVVEIRRRGDGAHVVQFHFTTAWPKPVLTSPEERVTADRAFRVADREWGQVARAYLAAPTAQAREAIKERASELLRRHGALHERLWPHFLRMSKRVKQKQWEWRSGQSGLASHGLGPVVLSPRTTPRVITLKMGVLSVRAGVLRESAPLVDAVHGYLRLEHPDDAAEVFGRAAMGYVGDVSPFSFRSYLRKIAESIERERGQGHAAELAEVLANGGDTLGVVAPDVREILREETTRVLQHSKQSDELDEGRAIHVRLPGDEPAAHPWAAGRPALLRRLAEDYAIEPHVAWSWWRAGKLKAQSCRSRMESTLLGNRIWGTIEIPASELRTWEDRCAVYVDKQERKRLSTDGTPAERKRRYRAAAQRGGSREQAAEMVRRRAREAGVLDLVR